MTTISIALLVAGLGLVAFGLYGFIIRYKVTHEPNPTIPKEIVTKSIDTPSETAPVEACTNYDVPTSQPRQISIPKLNKTGCIQKVGIDQNNAIAVPTNIHLAGWYTASSLPGESGVTLIDGHISGRYEDAIFANLKDLKPGDEVKIQLGDKTWISYVIKDTNTYAIDKAADEQLRQLSGVKSQLTIVTCGGEWLPHDKTYDKRVVVRAAMKGEDD